jgi:hypothetical protein
MLFSVASLSAREPNPRYDSLSFEALLRMKKRFSGLA